MGGKLQHMVKKCYRSQLGRDEIIRRSWMLNSAGRQPKFIEMQLVELICLNKQLSENSDNNVLLVGYLCNVTNQEDIFLSITRFRDASLEPSVLNLMIL